MKISLVIPVYNEAQGVYQTAAQIHSALDYLRKHHDTELILVDDGSLDDTRQLLDDAFCTDSQVQILSHEHNRGVGAALATGFKQATGDIIITTDFDGTYPFSSIPQIVARMQVEKVDIVVGSPYHRNASMQGIAPLSRLTSMLYRLIVDSRIHSWTSLFCAYRREVVKRIPLNENNVLAETELLVNALLRGYRVAEIPVTFTRRTFGRSHRSKLRRGFAHLSYLALLPLPVLTTRMQRFRSALTPKSVQPVLKD